MKQPFKIRLFPPSDIIGGHTPSTTSLDLTAISDGQDLIGEGIFTRFENTSPVREGLGILNKRRATQLFLNRIAPYNGANDNRRICNMVYVPGMRVIETDGTLTQDDAIFISYDGDESTNWQVNYYTPSNLYNGNLFGGDYQFDTADASTATSGNIYPDVRGNVVNGDGLFLPAKLGAFAYMAFGAYPDTYPCKALWAVYDNQSVVAARVRDAFFADPNTAADAGGRILKHRAPIIVPERPYFNLGANSGVTVETMNGYVRSQKTPLVQISDDLFVEGTTNIALKGGLCYEGDYEWRLLPIDEIGQAGPPLASGKHTIRGKEFHIRQRGSSLAWTLTRITTLVSTLRPNISAFDLYVSYKPNNPRWSFWTDPSPEQEENGTGYGLPTPPEEIPMSFFRRLSSKNRQFKGNDATTAYGATGANAETDKWTADPEFNRHITRTGEEIRATKQSDTALWITDRQLYPYNFLSIPGAAANQTTAEVHVEIIGPASESARFGTYKVTQWDYDRDESTDTGGTVKLTVSDMSGATITNGTELEIRFVNPYVDDQADEVRTTIWMTDPEAEIDRSKPYPFGLNDDKFYTLDYPNYFGHCESPDGRFRNCWNYWLNGIVEKSVLKGTWVNYFGVPEPSRFRVSVRIPNEITGAAYVSKTQLVVTTRDRSYICEWNNVDGTWILDRSEDELELGNSFRALYTDNRFVYGFDYRRGAWRIKIDPERDRIDISPVGSQVKLMNKGQQAWIRSFFQTESSFERLAAGTIARSGDYLVWAFPKFTGSAKKINSGSHNSFKDNDSSGNFWLTMYEINGTVMWSYDYGYADLETDLDGYIPLNHLNIGPAGNIIGDRAQDAAADANDETNLVIGFADIDSQETDIDSSGSEQNIRSYVQTPRFILDNYPALGKIWKMFIRISKVTATAISTTITATPYTDDAAGTAETNTAITTSGWRRGWRALGRAWEIMVSDTSAGTMRFKELWLQFTHHGRFR
jgi:hypothetical protein